MRLSLRTSSRRNYTTVYVKTIKQIQKRKIDVGTAIPRGITYLTHQGKVLNDKKTIEESDIEAETTIEMSLRLLGGMEKSEMIDSFESEEEREKIEKLEEMSE